VRRSFCCRVVTLAVLAAPLLTDCGGGDSASQPTSIKSTSTTPSTSGIPPDSPYKAGLRAAYLPVLDTLGRLGASCNPVSRAKLSKCRARLKSFQTAVARLQRYVVETPPPADAKAQARTVAGASRTMQGTWTKLANYEKQGNLAAANAMAGFGKPLTNNLMAWLSAVQDLDLKLPGALLPVPSG
jgi:hypothetical protein